MKVLRREERTDEIAQLIRELNNYSKYYPTYEESSLQVGNMSNIPQYEEFKDLVLIKREFGIKIVVLEPFWPNKSQIWKNSKKFALISASQQLLFL